MWIRTGVTVWKRLSWVMTSVTLTFDLWPWPFAWTSLLSWVITPENFVMIRWWEHSQQGKSEGFDSCDRPSYHKLDSNRQIFRPCDREIWWMTSKNNRALLLYYVKLCASFQIHWWIQTGFTVQERSIRVEIGDMLSRVTLKFDAWPWKTIWHLFYATSSFVQHFIPIGEFKLELRSGNAQSGSNLKFLEPCDLEIWRMTSKNNRAPLLCYFKLCASFRTHWWIQT